MAAARRLRPCGRMRPLVLRAVVGSRGGGSTAAGLWNPGLGPGRLVYRVSARRVCCDPCARPDGAGPAVAAPRCHSFIDRQAAPRGRRPAASAAARPPAPAPQPHPSLEFGSVDPRLTRILLDNPRGCPPAPLCGALNTPRARALRPPRAAGRGPAVALAAVPPVALLASRVPRAPARLPCVRLARLGPRLRPSAHSWPLRSPSTAAQERWKRTRPLGASPSARPPGGRAFSALLCFVALFASAFRVTAFVGSQGLLAGRGRAGRSHRWGPGQGERLKKGLVAKGSNW